MATWERPDTVPDMRICSMIGLTDKGRVSLSPRPYLGRPQSPPCLGPPLSPGWLHRELEF